ncbi:MAG: cytidine deaminase [Ferruginibacter sp.]
MRKEEISFEYEIYESIDELTANDAALLQEARSITTNAYAPYSGFLVGAVARMKNGATVSGTNQENAAYPVGICAERVLMSVAAVLYPNESIDTLAISYHNLKGTSNSPVSPCGMCRQALKEFEDRTAQPIRLILSGEAGSVFVISKSTQLLPFSFGSKDMSQ